MPYYYHIEHLALLRLLSSQAPESVEYGRTYVLDYLAILKRRRRYFFSTALLILTLAVVLAFHWSNYRSAATVQIEGSEIPAGVTAPIGMSSGEMLEALADQRISQIEQKVTSTASLVDIITKFNLYPNKRQTVPIADLTEYLHSKIKVGLVSSNLANPAAANKESPEQLSAIAFTVAFDYSEPLITQQVTNELVTRFLDEDLKMRREQAQQTAAFLGAQITALEGTLADQEKKIADFRATHGDSRPEALMFNQQTSQGITLSIQNLDSQITANEGTQGSLRGQITNVDPYSRVIADGQVLTTPAIQLKALQAQYSTLTAQYGPDHPDVVKAKHQIESLQAEIGSKGGTAPAPDTAQLKAQIADLQTNLNAAKKTQGTRKTPDVVSLTHQLEKLQAQLAEQNTSARDNHLKADADNPAYLELVSQLHSLEEQHKSLQEQRAGLVEQQKKYQMALSETPGISEQEMASLSRDYDNAQLRYRELKEKKMAADMGTQMQEQRIGERLVVIKPPQLTTKTQPSRMLLLLGGFMLSVMGGIASVVVAEAIGQSIHGTQHLGNLVGIAPLVSVPYLYTSSELGRLVRVRQRFFGNNY